jgi:hypothetical protein
MSADHPPASLTPQQAVSHAKRTVYVVVMLVMWGPAALGFLIGAVLSIGSPIELAVLGFVIGWPGAWLAWSLLTPRWRVWAYERVSDLDELKRLAVEAKILWPEGHALERTEIRPAAIRERLRELELRRRAERPTSA